MTLSTTSPGDEREAFNRPENYDRVSPDARQSILMSLERHIVVMQAALIEARHNGPAAGLQWIENTLDGPGLIPDDDEPDAQAYFDLHAPSIDACCFDRASSSTVQQVGADDTARLDWLERRINEDGAIHLHDGKHPHGTGLGLRPGLMVRTLRQAIDQAMPKSEGDQQ
jgi:hypothetical protein